jgi:3D-(3,5/4)-trihydroxycyclohexane-1,2-dione acylhydrolase (decyclizing)
MRITTAESIVRYLIAQRVRLEVTPGAATVEAPLVPGAFAIFGHGNVTSLGHSLEMHRDELPLWRGQNEQGMGLAAVAYAKAMRRQQFMLATSSVGPGATNMVTAAGVAMSNRLPALFICGDTFHSRLPDPVLQQVEHFGAPSMTVNDAFRPVVRYWDRITDPAQVLTSLPQAIAMMRDPGECGPAFLGLPQDVAAEAYDFPEEFFTVVVHEPLRPRADVQQLDAAAALLRSAERPLIIAGGGVHYSLAEADLADFAMRHGIPVVETVAGKSSLLGDHPRYAGPVGVTGAEAANVVAGEADVILAIGSRLQDFTTGSWTAFHPDAHFIGLNAARFDAVKHRSVPVVGDAREGMRELGERLAGWTAPTAWTERGTEMRGRLDRFIASRAELDGGLPLSYAQVIGVVHAQATSADYVLTAAGGLPGELNITWSSLGLGTFDCEYGFSCMGYELSGGWGAALARAQVPGSEVVVLVGDGSYLMMNSDIYSAALAGTKMTVIVCDNEGFAVIERLQVGQGGASFNNMLRDARGDTGARVDFAAHAAAMGAHAEWVSTASELAGALASARERAGISVIAIKVREADWTEGGAFWQVGVPEVSERAEVREARMRMDEGLKAQRRGV